MIAELTVQHAYIEGGDFNIPPRPRVALPGARFGLNREAGRYQITKIFAGQNEEDIYRSPLTEVGVDVKVGDYVLAINGEELRPDDDPYRLLRNKADAPVQLTVNSRPTTEGARVVSYRPVTDEQSLLYLDWVTGNMAKVEGNRSQSRRTLMDFAVGQSCTPLVEVFLGRLKRVQDSALDCRSIRQRAA